MDAKPLLDIVVVGGSLTGLAAGAALRTLPNVRSITILERYHDAQLEDQGAGIRVGVEVQEFYQKYAGVAPHTYSLPMSKFKVLSGDGDVIVDRDIVSSFATSWGQLFRVLRDAFLTEPGSCDCRYMNGCRVASIEEKDSKVDVVFLQDPGNEQTISADLVLGADGASSAIRQIISPETKRTYSGYVIQRGLVPIEQLSYEARATFEESALFCWNHNSQAISYNVPGNRGSAEDAGVVCNWGWYSAKTEEELQDLMTDASGVEHAFSLPIGGMQTKWVEAIKQTAQRELPRQFAEIVQKTVKPFVQVVTDSLATKNVFCGGKVLLLGDAAAGQRPHTASAVTQCVFAACLLAQHLRGQVSIEDWSRETYHLSSIVVRAGKELGQVCLSTSHESQERMEQYLKIFFAVQSQLLSMWRDVAP